jgi:serine protease Do
MRGPRLAQLKFTGIVTLTFAAGLLAAGLLHLPTRSLAQERLATHSDSRSPIPAASSLVDLSNAFASVAEQVKPSVVYIESQAHHRKATLPVMPPGMERFFPRFPGVPDNPGGSGLERSSGSGVVVSSDGYIMTNAHVVDDADRVTVRLLDHREFRAKVVGADQPTDIALLKVDASNLTAAPLGNSDDARVGEWVLAVGNPLGQNLTFTVTSGIISAKGRALDLPNRSERSIQDFIQTDAAINPGNSGGPLVDVQGEVIGINAAIASETGYYTGYGFAIPINLARQVMDQLVHGGTVHRAALGVRVRDATENDANYVGLSDVRGVVVEDFGDSSSPAKAAGLEPGDVIIAVDGARVDYVGQIQQSVGFRKPGDVVAVEVARKGGVRSTIKVRLQAAPDPTSVAERGSSGNETDEGARAQAVARLGVTAQPLTNDDLADLGLATGTRGLVITGVDQDGPAAGQLADPDDGGPDVVLSVEGKPVGSVSDLEAALRGQRPGAIVELVVYNARAHSRRVERVRLGK